MQHTPHDPYSGPTTRARTSRSGRRTVAAYSLAAAVVGAVTTAVLATPQLALAHAKLRSSSPAAGSTVTAAPRELRLTFSEKPELAFTRITLLAGKEAIALGKVAADAKSATTVVVVTLLAIHALDNPYRPGLGSLKPVAMERTLRVIAEAREAIGQRSPLPCDEEGLAHG